MAETVFLLRPMNGSLVMARTDQPAFQSWTKYCLSRSATATPQWMALVSGREGAVYSSGFGFRAAPASGAQLASSSRPSRSAEHARARARAKRAARRGGQR